MLHSCTAPAYSAPALSARGLPAHCAWCGGVAHSGGRLRTKALQQLVQGEASTVLACLARAATVLLPDCFPVGQKRSR